MVLSNKKLKQKARATLAESLAASVGGDLLLDPDFPGSNPQTQSLKELLQSTNQKPRLSKREKKRKNLESSGTSEDLSKSSGDGKDEAKEALSAAGVDGIDMKRKKKKRKTYGNGDNEEIEREAALGEKVSGKKATKKNKKKKKKEKEEKNEEQNKATGAANGGSKEQGVVEAIGVSNGEENGNDSLKVYVGGIPYYSTEDDIRSFFEGCGSITEVDCMTFPESGKFRGIAILSFKTDAAAKRAVALDGADMGGLYLKIQPYKATRSNKASDFAPKMVEGYNRIYAGNLSWDITKDDLKKLFSGCNVSSIRFGTDKETGEFRGYAHVDFADNLSLTMALKLDQQIVCGRPVKISCAVPRKGTDNHSKSKEISKKTDENKMGSKSEEISEKANNNKMGSVTRKMKRRTCYECGVAGHISSDCPKKQATEASS